METKNQQHENTLNCYRMPPTGNYVNLFVHTAKINIIVMGICYSSEDCFFSYTKNTQKAMWRKWKDTTGKWEKYYDVKRSRKVFSDNLVILVFECLPLMSTWIGGDTSRSGLYIKNHKQSISEGWRLWAREELNEAMFHSE